MWDPERIGAMRSDLAIGGVLVGVLLTLGGCKKAQVRPAVPDIYRVKFETTQGDFTVEVTKAWAPAGADRFHELVWIRYFDQGRFFRVLPGFIAQFGVHKDFKVHDVWRVNFIPDDPRKQDNVRGTLAFAKSGPATRATEIFINLADNAVLDEQGFVPFARIVEGMDVPGKFYSGYGELGPEGKGPDAGRIEVEANEYLAPRFPKLDYIKQATFVP
jgi:peptidyl-prolyl cis-trans isomerase A (cyclophilin A)